MLTVAAASTYEPWKPMIRAIPKLTQWRGAVTTRPALVFFSSPLVMTPSVRSEAFTQFLFFTQVLLGALSSCGWLALNEAATAVATAAGMGEPAVAVAVIFWAAE